MRVLLVLAHFYGASKNSRHSSGDIGKRTARKEALTSVLRNWRAHFGATANLQIDRKEFRETAGMLDQLDIVVLTTADNHLLDDVTAKQFSVKHVNVSLNDTRMLPFAAHDVMASARSKYDWFVYSEDDLRLSDASFFIKQTAFQLTYGWRRVLQPNRYELNDDGCHLKTYVDGDLRVGLTAPYFSSMRDDDYLRLNMGGSPVALRRALNPHSGFFALTSEQLDYWVRQPHFRDHDCSFVSPLESAATLGILKTFAIYKPFSASAGFLEIEHLDTRFSGMRLPVIQ